MSKLKCTETMYMSDGKVAFVEGKSYDYEVNERGSYYFKSEVTKKFTHFMNQELIREYFVFPRVYICGPITGLPNNNRPAFHAAEELLCQRGFHPINPHVLCFDIVNSHKGTEQELWTKCMKRDISVMIDCDYVVLLPGWHKSRGAMVEINTASAVGIPCIPIKEFLAKHV